MRTCKTALLDSASLFEQLSPSVKECLLSKARTVSFERGSTICLQGEPASALKIVQSGWVKLYRVLPNGSETILSTLTLGQSFDEAAALQRTTSLSSAEAVSDCTVVYFDLTSICSCDNAFREISTAIMAAASHQVDVLMGEVEKMKTKTGTQRLTEYLIDLSEAKRDPYEINLPFEKVLLAGKLGMKPESLSRAFARLKSLGVKTEHKQVWINDVATLRAYSEMAETTS